MELGASRRLSNERPGPLRAIPMMLTWKTRGSGCHEVWADRVEHGSCVFWCCGGRVRARGFSGEMGIARFPPKRRLVAVHWVGAGVLSSILRP